MSKISDLFKKISNLFNRNKGLPEGKDSINFPDYQPRESQSTFISDLQSHAEMSMLNPNRYQSQEEFCIALLEDMGLDSKFKQNPRAKNDLADLVSEVIGKDELDAKTIEDSRRIQESLTNSGIVISSDGKTISRIQKESSPSLDATR